MARVTTAAGAAVAVSIALAGCTPTTEHASTVAATPPTIWTGAPAPDDRSVGTLHQYIVDNQIAEVPFKPNDPGTPKVDFPFLPIGARPATGLPIGLTAPSSTTRRKIRRTRPSSWRSPPSSRATLIRPRFSNTPRPS